jgi:hypothetical protein
LLNVSTAVDRYRVTPAFDAALPAVDFSLRPFRAASPFSFAIPPSAARAASASSA